MTSDEQYQECLEWLESLDGYYIGDEEREYMQENFSEVEFDFVGVTSHLDEGEIKTPINDYIHTIRYDNVKD